MPDAAVGSSADFSTGLPMGISIGSRTGPSPAIDGAGVLTKEEDIEPSDAEATIHPATLSFRGLILCAEYEIPQVTKRTQISPMSVLSIISS